MQSVVQVLPLVPLLAAVGCSQSQLETQEGAFESLVRAERSFASTSVAFDTRTAFLENFAADGVVFDAGPVNARSVWEQRPAGGPILSWGPEIADVSAAGDLGYTSGPFEVRTAPDTDPVAWGHFVSVWRRNSEGTWKVVADGGVAHGPASLGPDSVVVRAAGSGEMPSELNEGEIDAATSALRRYDVVYSGSVAEKGFAESMDDFVDQSARFYRNGHLPLVGRDVIDSAASVAGAVWTDWEARGVILSNSGDLGCTYGTVQMLPEQGEETTPHASYYRIWKQDAYSGWRVVVDVLIPMAPTGQ